MANLTLDFLHNYNAGERRDTEPANAYQYDEGHILEAIVPTAITSCEIQYWIRGMDEAEAYEPTSITENSDGTYTILGNIPNDYFETNGELRIYIVVTDDDASITNYEGRLHICQRSMPDDYVGTDPDNSATSIIAVATESAEAAEAWAVGTIDGVAVESTADQYENNSKYYAEQAATVAESIPEDYSTLSTQVATNTSDISDVKDDLQDIQGTGLTASDEGKALKIKTVTNGSVSEWEFGTAGGVDPSDIAEAVDDYMADHPVVASAAGIVSVADYGAVGDGVTDDSAAIQSAVDANYDVYFESNKTYYLASTVTIDHDIKLHGGENTVIMTKTPSGGTVNSGIVVTGTLKTTTTLTTDYTSVGTTDNSGNQFTLSSMTGIEVGDIMVVTATDQYFHYARPYYYLGATLLVSDVYDGHIYTSNSMPFDIENTANVAVTVYSAPTVIIENLNFESDLDSIGTYTYLIDLKWCKNSVLRNVCLSQMNNGIRMYYSVNTLVDGVTVSKAKYDSALSGDSYAILVHSSSETIIQRVLSICSGGCVEMSGQIPNINTYVRNCNLASECRASGLSMHENAYNTVVEDCTLTGIMGYGTMTVSGCRFIVNNRYSGSSAITYIGGHNSQFSTLAMRDCVIDGTRTITIDRPTGQSPVQSYDNIIEKVEISNCIGGSFAYAPTTNSEVLSNTIEKLLIKSWKDCLKIYHTSGNVIKFLGIADSTFTGEWFITDNTSAIVFDGIEYLDYQSTNPLEHKVYKSGTVYADDPVLPEGVPITLSSSNSSAVFRICGANLAPNVADDYRVGSVTGSVGSAITRTTNSNATVTIDSDGNPVYTQNGSTSTTAAFYPVGMTYVREKSVATISATVKNTGSTDGATFRPYIAIVDCDTGLITYRNNGTEVTATSAGVTATHTRVVPANSVVLCYFYCSSGVISSQTTFEDMTITVAPYFIAPVVDEEYTAKRLTGNGTLTSLDGVNNIMCSESTFTVTYSADLVNNPVGLLPSGQGVSF